MAAMPSSLSRTTIAISAGRPAPTPDGPLSEPITLASTFHAGGPNGYARDGHPGWAAFEEAIGTLDDGHAVAFSTGMAACSAVLDQQPVGATVVAPHEVYMGVRQLLEEAQAGGHMDVRWVDITDTAATLAATAGADVLWLEIPLNPLLSMADLPALIAPDGGSAVAGALETARSSRVSNRWRDPPRRCRREFLPGD